MEWVVTILTGMALVFLLSPLIVLFLTFFVLVPLALFAPPPPMISRASFDCPFARRRVNVAFLSTAGSAQPSDVESCSVFDGAVRCRKGCLWLAHTSWAPSPMVPRYSLIADGTAPR